MSTLRSSIQERHSEKGQGSLEWMIRRLVCRPTTRLCATAYPRLIRGAGGDVIHLPEKSMILSEHLQRDGGSSQFCFSPDVRWRLTSHSPILQDYKSLAPRAVSARIMLQCI